MEETNSQQEKVRKHPHVQLFGQDLGEKQEEVHNARPRDYNGYQHYHRHHGLDGVVWGFIVLFAGAVLLLNNFGLVPWEFWNYVWPFWPGLIILIGVHIILGQNMVSRVITALLALALLAAIVIYGIVHSGSPLAYSLPSGVLNFFKSLNLNNF